MEIAIGTRMRALMLVLSDRTRSLIMRARANKIAMSTHKPEVKEAPSPLTTKKEA